jgi:hypothetical protein
MILTVKGLSGEPGALGARNEAAPEPSWTYNRAPLVILTGSAAVLTLFGVAGVGWHLANGNALMVLASF